MVLGATLEESELYLGKNLTNVQFSFTVPPNTLGSFSSTNYNPTTGYASYVFVGGAFEQREVYYNYYSR